MRRFSQRNFLVTLSDINITPLLDLAFVLLIIFIITTPLLDQGMELRLPAGGRPDRRIDKANIRTVEIDSRGHYALDKTRLPLDQIEAQLVKAHRANDQTIVYIRADLEAQVKYLYPLIERCQRHNITRFSLRTEPPRR
jgi:biopolymer transport protein ExbD